MTLSLLAGLLAFAWTDPLNVDVGAVPPLEGAVWEGEVRIQIDGSLFSQYLANRRVNDSDLPGYMKEKGEMKLNYLLVLRFQVDALGEFSVIGADNLQGRRQMRREFRYKFKEEVEVNRLKVDRTVQVAEITMENVRFDEQQTYSRDELPGSLRFLPSGNLDDNGSLKMSGELTLSYQAKGTSLYSKSRQPANDEGNLQKKGTIQRSFTVPVSFNVEVQLRQEPVQGSVAVQAQFDNPFSQDDADHRRRAIFTDRLNISGSYRMTPLFTDP